MESPFGKIRKDHARTSEEQGADSLGEQSSRREDSFGSLPTVELTSTSTFAFPAHSDIKASTPASTSDSE